MTLSHLAQKLLLAIVLAALLPGLGKADSAIISRADWKAKPAISVRTPPIATGKFSGVTVVSENKMPLRKPAVYLTVHHDVVPANPDKATANKMRVFQRNMQDGYWIGETKHIYLGDTPYHYYVSSTGDIAEGRSSRD